MFILIDDFRSIAFSMLCGIQQSHIKSTIYNYWDFKRAVNHYLIFVFLFFNRKTRKISGKRTGFMVIKTTLF